MSAYSGFDLKFRTFHNQHLNFSESIFWPLLEIYQKNSQQLNSIIYEIQSLLRICSPFALFHLNKVFLTQNMKFFFNSHFILIILSLSTSSVRQVLDVVS